MAMLPCTTHHLQGGRRNDSEEKQRGMGWWDGTTMTGSNRETMRGKTKWKKAQGWFYFLSHPIFILLTKPFRYHEPLMTTRHPPLTCEHLLAGWIQGVEWQRAWHPPHAYKKSLIGWIMDAAWLQCQAHGDDKASSQTPPVHGVQGLF